MKQLFSNRYIEAFVKSIAMFGVIHLFILILLAFRGNVQMLNFFSILDISALVPSLGEGIDNFILSECIAFTIYCFVFLRFTKSRKDK